ncbi:hypothetical protein [Streptomyces hokutonensis]|uniref:hypothetical protein n=1 Tax=Streptomyces hokutonensis TaxID=1306990 RepID=UPI003812F8A2
MDSETAFAALLAQVIPVVMLAIVVEARETHRLQMDAPAGQPLPKVQWLPLPAQLVWEAILFGLLIFMELAALLTADGHRMFRWVAGFTGAIGVVLLFAMLSQVYIQTTAAAYHAKGRLSDGQCFWISRGADILVAASVIAGLVAISRQ